MDNLGFNPNPVWLFSWHIPLTGSLKWVRGGIKEMYKGSEKYMFDVTGFLAQTLLSGGIELQNNQEVETNLLIDELTFKIAQLAGYGKESVNGRFKVDPKIDPKDVEKLFRDIQAYTEKQIKNQEELTQAEKARIINGFSIE